MRKIFKVIVVFFILLAILGGYYTFKQKATNSGAAQTITVVDSVGRSVVIPEKPQRVIILNPSNIEIYYAAGGTTIAKPLSTSYNAELKEKLASLPETGIIHSPNLEKILSLQPDLIIGTDVPYHHAIIPPLEAAGIPILINSINSYEDVLRTLDLFGQLAGTESSAQQKKEAVMAEYKKVQTAAQNKQPPRSLIIFGAPNSFSMATKKSFSGNLVESLGGGNIADEVSDSYDAYVSLSMEYVTRKDPEVIFVITMGDADKAIESLRRDLRENPIWHDISAVRNNRIYQLPANLFTVNPGTQLAEAMTILSSYMYRGDE
ncbi:MAG TPA: ABC transporter substrate-binding protein [Candidatus Avacidaminococcus intestinavium]|uniref:ABC transporter substrate-binding protein n=1 Tax=Candidatus Avacidaminococcus intestinavium TaxID=2840684 RepID=A0A9D1SME2_9FIRM|nr:ABC transporter substrate-binding protein [Candidatus Avacidaminococcus intestinavium]